jgi:hypothetical protein
MYLAARAITTSVTITNAAIWTQKLLVKRLVLPICVSIVLTSLDHALKEPRQAAETGAEEVPRSYFGSAKTASLVALGD